MTQDHKLEINFSIIANDIVIDRAFEERVTAAVAQNGLKKGDTILVAGKQIRHEPGYHFGYPWLSDYHLVVLTDRYEGNDGALNASGRPGQGGKGGAGGRPGVDDGRGGDATNGEDGTDGGALTLFAREIVSARLVSGGGNAGTGGTGGTGVSGPLPGAGGTGGRGGKGGKGGNLQIVYVNLIDESETLLCFNDGGRGGNGGGGGNGGLGPNDNQGDGGYGGKGGNGGNGGDREISQLDEADFEARVVAALGEVASSDLKEMK